MARKRKPRINDAAKGPSALERLKNVVRCDPGEATILRARAQQIPALALISEIEQRHGIEGLEEPRLSEFWGWLDGHNAMQAANASVENLHAIYSQEELTPEAVHAHLVKVLRITGMREGDNRTLKFVTEEMRKVMELSHEREKWIENQRDKRDAGLDAVFEEIKHDAVAVELFAKIRERITK